MSSRSKHSQSKALSRRSFALALGGALLCAPLISACQFQPLYGSGSGRGSLNEVMKLAEVLRVEILDHALPVAELLAEPADAIPRVEYEL